MHGNRVSNREIELRTLFNWFQQTCVLGEPIICAPVSYFAARNILPVCAHFKLRRKIHTRAVVGEKYRDSDLKQQQCEIDKTIRNQQCPARCNAHCGCTHKTNRKLSIAFKR